MSNVPTGDPAVGAKIFKQRCAQCHTTEKVCYTFSLAVIGVCVCVQLLGRSLMLL